MSFSIYKEYFSIYFNICLKCHIFNKTSKDIFVYLSSAFFIVASLPSLPHILPRVPHTQDGVFGLYLRTARRIVFPRERVERFKENAGGKRISTKIAPEGYSIYYAFYLYFLWMNNHDNNFMIKKELKKRINKIYICIKLWFVYGFLELFLN